MALDIERALVTGANGFIGGALTLRLLAEGVTVRAMCRDPEKGRFLSDAAQASDQGGRLELVRGDVQDAATVDRYARGCDVVFHVAAVGSGSAAVHYRANVQGSENVAQAALAAGAKRLIHVSSIAVYGFNVGGEITETHPQKPSPHDFYQQTKALGETAVWRIAHETSLPTTVVRPALVYGPRSGAWTVRMNQLAKQLPFIPNLGSATTHPIYIDDLIDLMLNMATHPAALGNAFNASADPPVTWNEFLGHIARIAGNPRRAPLPIGLLKRLARPLDAALQLTGDPQDVYGMLSMLSNYTVYCTDKATRLLGWRPRVSLADGMTAAEKWLRSTNNS